MDASRAIEALARARTVETMVASIAGRPLDADLEDLCQIVYLALLEYDPAKVCELCATGEIRFFIARVVMNQLRSTKSPYHQQVRAFRSRTEPLEENDGDG